MSGLKQKFSRKFGKYVSNFLNNLARFKLISSIFERLLKLQMSRTDFVAHSDTGFSARFFVPNFISHYRVASFYTKEPETIKWIETIPDDGVFWDIGANIGLYSIYAALRRGRSRVVSFEPSVFNLEWLARNIHLNNLQNRISIVPIALTESCGFNKFRMSNISWGGALSTFGEKFDQNGENLRIIFEYETIGLTLASAYRYFSLPKPSHIKIDVDGIEHLILRGAGEVLSFPQEILVEINDAFVAQSTESSNILRHAGFRLAEKFYLGLPNQYNQLWRR